MHLRSFLIVGLLCGAGCAPFARLQARAPASESGPFAVPSSVPADRTEFLADLGILGPAATTASDAPTDSGRLSGRVRIIVHPNDTFEYQLTILNADSVTFRTGEVYRASADVWGDPVATLFSEVSLTGPYVQLRGTGQVARTLRATVLLEEMREVPGDFVVRVRGESGRPVILAGPLR